MTVLILGCQALSDGDHISNSPVEPELQRVVGVHSGSLHLYLNRVVAADQWSYSKLLYIFEELYVVNKLLSLLPGEQIISHLIIQTYIPEIFLSVLETLLPTPLALN